MEPLGCQVEVLALPRFLFACVMLVCLFRECKATRIFTGFGRWQRISGASSRGS